MKIYLQRHGDYLKPLSEWDHDSIKRIKDGQIIYVDYKKPRNPLFHNKFMALVRLIYQNQEEYKSIESLLNVFKVELGYYDSLYFRGQEIRVPRSISFAAMDEIAFQDFYDKAVELALHRFFPAVTPAELEEYVNQIAHFAD